MIVSELYAKLGIRADRLSIARAQKNMRRFTSGLSKRFSGLNSSLTRSIAGIGAAYAGISAVRDQLSLTEQFGRLEIAAKGTMGTMEDIRQSIDSASMSTGIARKEILEGAKAFVRVTGDGKTAKESMKTFAKITQATGADMGDITEAAAGMNQSLGIGSEQFEKAFSALTAGGKAGKIEIKELAGLIPSLGPQMAMFSGGKGMQGLSDMGASLQFIAKGFGSANEAGTGMQSLFKAITSGPTLKKLQSAGIDPFGIDENGNKVTRNFLDIIEDIANSKIAKDPKLLADTFIRIESKKAFLQMMDNVDAIRELSATTQNANDVAEDYAKINENATIGANRAWNILKIRVGQAIDFVIKHIVDLVDNHLPAVVTAFGILAAMVLPSLLAMVAPWLFMAAGITAVALLVEDFWKSVTEGQGVFADLGRWIKGVFNDLWQDVKDFADNTVRELKSIPDRLLGRHNVTGRTQNIKRFIKTMQSTGQNSRQIMAAGVRKGFTATELKRAAPNVFNNNAQITVNAPGGDPRQVSRGIQEGMSKSMKDAFRPLSAAVGVR